MAIVNKVEKKIKTTKQDVIEYQVITNCFFKGMSLKKSDIKLLSRLAIEKEIEISNFCDLIVEEKILKNPQSVRNTVYKLNKQKVIKRGAANKKLISLNDDFFVQVDGLVFLDFKILGNES